MSFRSFFLFGFIVMASLWRMVAGCLCFLSTAHSIDDVAYVVDVPVRRTVRLCARTVNVSGACRRRRGRWMEEPVVLTFDDDTTLFVDRVMQPAALALSVPQNLIRRH